MLTNLAWCSQWGLPMLRVTVMMLRDMVESVMLLKEDDYKAEEEREW